MTAEEIWNSIEEVDLEKVQREIPKGQKITINGAKIPPKTEDEKQLFWNHLLDIDEGYFSLDSVDYYIDARFPNYKFVQ